ncbi:Retrovirus-related Pol polyprotein from transposon TNT 1-94 [Araneus ventricosus]|uniref:Retrovirus-related Pol polyprotein from transposon TNT 1-94 n=1 Tax=Araneus ventricosus TaxID=182803 RepID=A0A4Y2LGZ9_ARAVE|nr:Retrovirus-related Pol polyprotein from transposon TNT 1-94 [Araneus ventricosus]
MEAESFVYKIDSTRTFEEAINSKESANWKKAMRSEMASNREHQTYELTDLPAGSKTLPCVDGFSETKHIQIAASNKYKARLVAKGYVGCQSIDYSKTYSPIIKFGTIRAIFSISAVKKMYLWQFDAYTVFIYGKLNETIYLQQPKGYKDGAGRVYKLKHRFYCLKNKLQDAGIRVLTNFAENWF